MRRRLSDTSAIVSKGIRPQLGRVAWPGADVSMAPPMEFPANFARDASPDMEKPNLAAVINRED